MSKLSIVGTPIGNLEDITYRAVRILKEADLIAAEDTRKARILLGHYDIGTKTTTLFSGQEDKQTEAVLRRLLAGDHVALISEAGMPGISDPGYPLIAGCIEHQIEVDVIPGPTAVTTALLLSGLRCDAFRFIGFLPRKGAARTTAIEGIQHATEPTIIFESPKRLTKTLQQLAEIMPERNAAVCRELTKLYQEARRGTVKDLGCYYAEHPPRGEIVVVIDTRGEQSLSEAELDALIQKELAQGASPRDVSKTLAELGSKRAIYQRALQLNTEN